jgi:predicted nucleic acid-binding protein
MIPTAKSIILDTNVIIYLLNKDSKFHKKALNTITKLISKENELFIPIQVVRETLVVVTRKDFFEKPLTPKRAVRKTNEILKNFQILGEDEESIKALIKLVRKYNIKGKKIHDANIVAVAITNNINYIFTYNVEDFKNFKEIKILS